MGNWNDIFIKSADDSIYRNGYDTYHVRMGQGFLDALEGGIPLKEVIENSSRIEHGVRMIVNTKMDKRSLTLKFLIFGATRAQYMQNKRNFETMLLKGIISLKVNDANHTEYYHLVYTGKSVTYNHSYNGTFGMWTAQFTEPNPYNRTSSDNAYVRVI